MEIYVACDICGHRYVLSGDKEGRKSKCKSCGVGFEIAEQNFYDPQTGEFDEPDEDEDDTSSNSPMSELMKRIGHVLTALATLSVLVWMGLLLFRSPREAAARIQPAGVGKPGTQVNQVTAIPGRRGQHPNPAYSPPQLPSNFQPPPVPGVPTGPAGFTPPSFPQPQPSQGAPGGPSPFAPPPIPTLPTQFPNPQNRPQAGQRVPRQMPKPPASNGSIGWPKSDSSDGKE